MKQMSMFFALNNSKLVIALVWNLRIRLGLLPLSFPHFTGLCNCNCISGEIYGVDKEMD